MRVINDRPAHGTDNRGAALVEFTIVGILFFGIVGAFIFFGIFLYRYSVLSDAVPTVIREVVVDAQTTERSVLTDTSLVGGQYPLLSVARRIVERLRYFGFKSDTVRIGAGDIVVCNNSATKQCLLKASVKWDMPCFGFCIFVPTIKTLSVSSTSVFEDPCFVESMNGCGGAPAC